MRQGWEQAQIQESQPPRAFLHGVRSTTRSHRKSFSIKKLCHLLHSVTPSEQGSSKSKHPLAWPLSRHLLWGVPAPWALLPYTSYFITHVISLLHMHFLSTGKFLGKTKWHFSWIVFLVIRQQCTMTYVMIVGQFDFEFLIPEFP
jgi:hypothetical protein